MPQFEDDVLKSNNGYTNLRLRFCRPDGAPRGIVQIAHGIAEHVERYDGFAEFLAEHGFLVVANDHLGHGKSIHDPSEQGYFAELGGWHLVVEDMRKVYNLIHEGNLGLPYFLFGHSMGSFLTRTYLIRFRDDLTGAILSGTGQTPRGLVTAGRRMAQAIISRHGGKYKSMALNNMAFGKYNKGFDHPRTKYDWLSRDGAVADQYIEDPLCGFVPTAGLFADMMAGIAFNQDTDNLGRMRKDLPVYFMSGDRDPVGADGKGVFQAYQSFLNAGMLDVTLKLYAAGRHEMLNELNKEQVYQDILWWIEGRMK